ncbi:TPA: ead/Ea22-like family protein [Raoultella planticola]
MTTDITELAQILKAAAEKATPGEWWSDVVETGGTHGSGEDCMEGFHSYAVYDQNNHSLLDMTNSTAACITVEDDGDYIMAWDEVGRANAEFIALANPANILALVEALEKAQQQTTESENRVRKQNRHICELFDDNTALRQRIAEPEQKHCGGALMERELAHSQVINKLMSEIDNRDSRIAELESRTVTVKMPEVYGYLRENDGQIQISIGAERPSDRSGGYATPWFAIYTAAGIKWEAE